MTQYEIICVVLSSCALVISLIIAIKDLTLFFKNKITTKSLIVELSDLNNQIGWYGDLIYGTLSITNRTNKEFTIGDIVILGNGLNCKLWQSVSQEFNSTNQKVLQITEIRLLSHEMVKFQVVIQTDRLVKTTPAVLVLKTPYKNYGYPIYLPCYKEDDKNTESV